MKNLGILIVSVLAFSRLNAQKLNDKGLYVNDNENSAGLFNGELFNGVISETKNGVKCEFSVKNGIVDGAATYYYASGNKMETGEFKNGQKDQQWIRYNENGTTSAIAFYNLGKKNGTWLVFDDKGNKRFEMNYSNGDKSGVWTNWDENGTIVSSKDYSKLN